jgi:hypothetical protein
MRRKRARLAWHVQYSMHIRASAAGAGQRQRTNPLGMAELIAHEVEVALTTQAHGEEANHFVQRDSSLNHLQCSARAQSLHRLNPCTGSIITNTVHTRVLELKRLAMINCAAI